MLCESLTQGLLSFANVRLVAPWLSAFCAIYDIGAFRHGNPVFDVDQLATLIPWIYGMVILARDLWLPAEREGAVEEGLCCLFTAALRNAHFG